MGQNKEQSLRGSFGSDKREHKDMQGAKKIVGTTGMTYC